MEFDDDVVKSTFTWVYTQTADALATDVSVAMLGVCRLERGRTPLINALIYLRLAFLLDAGGASLKVWGRFGAWY